MHKFFNACLVLAVLVSAFFIYSLEQSTRGLERQIAKLKGEIQETRNSQKISIILVDRLFLLNGFS